VTMVGIRCFSGTDAIATIYSVWILYRVSLACHSAYPTGTGKAYAMASQFIPDPVVQDETDWPSVSDIATPEGSA
jgi:hypothetical protein